LRPSSGALQTITAATGVCYELGWNKSCIDVKVGARCTIPWPQKTSNNIVKMTHCLISKYLVLTRLDVIQKRSFIFTMEPGVCDVFGVLLSQKVRAKWKHNSYVRRGYKLKNRK